MGDLQGMVVHGKMNDYSNRQMLIGCSVKVAWIQTKLIAVSSPMLGLCYSNGSADTIVKILYHEDHSVESQVNMSWYP